MTNDIAGYDPMHIALKYVAATCIDEGLTEDAEDLARFLDLIDLAPRTVGLLHTWILSQRGQLREALSHCEELTYKHPEAEEFQPVLAVLRYTCQDPGWRVVCTALIESETTSADNKRLAQSLLDGSFGAPATAKPASESEVPAAPVAPIDYAALGAYMRV
jgi:hypothetical protein